MIKKIDVMKGPWKPAWKKDWQKRLDMLNAIGKKSWLIITCDIVDFLLPHHRMDEKPQQLEWPRFRLLSDGFLQMDFRILASGNMKVLTNRHLNNPAYPEDAAFAFPGFRVGKIVTFDKFLKHYRAYVEISNLRARYLVSYGQKDATITFNPRNNTITVRKMPGLEVFCKL